MRIPATCFAMLFVVINTPLLFASDLCVYDTDRQITGHHEGIIQHPLTKLDWYAELASDQQGFRSIHRVTNDGDNEISFVWRDIGLVVPYGSSLQPGYSAYQVDRAASSDVFYEYFESSISIRRDELYQATTFKKRKSLIGRAKGTMICYEPPNTQDRLGALINIGDSGISIDTVPERISVALSNYVVGVDDRHLRDYGEFKASVLSIHDLLDAGDIDELVTIYGPEIVEHDFLLVELRYGAAHLPTECVKGITPIIVFIPAHDQIVIGKLSVGPR